jgi:hypothetical protein
MTNPSKATSNGALLALQEQDLSSVRGGGGGGSRPAPQVVSPLKIVTHTTRMGEAESPASIQARETQRRQAELQRLQQLGQRHERLRDPHYHLPQFRPGR